MNRLGKVADYYAAKSLSVRFYDALTARDRNLRGDLAFYAARVGPAPQRVLELGCGTGRVALALAARGHQVVGVDISEPMLRIAQAKRKRLPAAQGRNVQFVLHDMLTLALPLRFHAVIAPYYAFNHLEGRLRRAQAVATMARHLTPGGTAIIHAASPEALHDKGEAQGPGAVIKAETTRARLEVTWSEPLLDEPQHRTTRLVDYQVYGADGSLAETSRERLTYYWFADDEVERAARKVGLDCVQRLASFEGEGGRERIYILKKPQADGAS
ncbi:MAG TPA: class I SAM-dependent methyltransferase [Beijerinckiaceae bacterium]|nr:class I SAM-dependent methyltransferase [Beijerinckiaceae bacterium]